MVTYPKKMECSFALICHIFFVYFTYRWQVKSQANNNTTNSLFNVLTTEPLTSPSQVNTQLNQGKVSKLSVTNYTKINDIPGSGTLFYSATVHSSLIFTLHYITN